MEDKCLVRTPSDRDFNERLQQLAIEAKQQPPLSPQRQLLLNRLVNKILQSGRLTHPQRGSWPPSLYEDLYNEALENCVQEWFDRSSFLKLRGYVLDEVGRNESARIIFRTQDEFLRKLPWHLWDLFERRPNVEFSISAKRALQTPALKKPVKILAILGGNEGSDTTEDLDLLKKLPKAKITLLQEPRREQLNDRLWDQPWDILFFAGHSSSQEGGNRGVIQLNDTESLSPTQLRYALRKALENGLKLAIFNSCDGLGLANELVDMAIPQAIVMREPVPDRVAQKFLQHFLKYFSKGESFYLAVRQAREKLQGMEGEFPCASWLSCYAANLHKMAIG